MNSTSVRDLCAMMQTKSSCVKMARGMVQGVAVDSRLVKAGDLFFALAGEQTDGHYFLGEAAAKGAVAAVVRKGYHGPDYGLELIESEERLKSLQLLAKAYLKRYQPRIIGVTGSVGKTTTKEFLGQLLKRKYRVSTSPGNHNSQIGLPLSILNDVQPEDEYLILEMGMTHPGQLSALIEIAPPTVAVVTMVALVHACNFSSLADIACAKAEIFTSPHTEMGIYHLESDCEGLLSKTGRCPKLSFSSADILSALPSYALPMPISGNHIKHNFLAASTVARYCGLTLEEIEQAIPTLKLPERRMQPVEKFGALFINDSYNASEVSMKAALESLPAPKPGSKRIAVLGEMLELGAFSAGCHRAVGQQALKNIDLMLCFGEGCRPIYECWQEAGRPVHWAKERKEIVDILRLKLQPGDVVLLKGSRGKGVWKVLEELEEEVTPSKK